MIDLWTSRRKKFINCVYYKKVENERYVSNNVLLHDYVPSGEFTAEILGSKNISVQVEGEAFMMKQKSLTIETNDKIEDLEENDIVKIKNETWRVDDIKITSVIKQTQFSITESKNYIITLRG